MPNYLISLDKNAHALRPVRANTKNNSFIYYTGTTFPQNPYQGCELTLRRCRAFGYIVGNSDIVLDVLDINGDVLQDFSISKKGFEYLRRVLKFRRETEDRYF